MTRLCGSVREQLYLMEAREHSVRFSTVQMSVTGHVHTGET